MTFSMSTVYTVFVVVSVQIFVIFAYNLQRIDYPRLELELENYSNNHPELDGTKYADAIKYFTAQRNFTNDVLVFSINSGSSSSGAMGTRYVQDNSSDTSVQPLNSWSVIWYVGSFGGLIAFFLIVSCSEWCCRRHARNRCSSLNENTQNTPQVPDTPPPSYDQFAPPAYESLVGSSRNGEKSEYDIYVVPAHALGTIMESHRHQQRVEPQRGGLGHQEDAPPSYLSASSGCMYPAFPTVPSVVSVPDNTYGSTGETVPVTVRPNNFSYTGSGVVFLEPNNTTSLGSHVQSNTRSVFASGSNNISRTEEVATMR